MLLKLFALAVAAVMIAGVTMAQAAQPETDAANAALQYIESLQNEDGGFPAFGTESTPGSTIDAVFALVAAGEDPNQVRLDNSQANTSASDYLVGRILVYTTGDAGATAKMALGLANIGIATDLVPNGYYNSDTGAYGDDLYDEAFYILALVQTQQVLPSLASTYLSSIQQPDGGWEFASGFGTDTNTTAMVLQALIAAGMAPNDAVVTDALGYLASAQNDDGGFAFAPGSDSDPNSTAVIIQALLAADQDIDVGGPWAPEGRAPLEGLLAFRNPDTGAFQYAGEDSAFATYQVVPALMLAPFPSLETRSDGFPPVPTSRLIGDPVPPTSTPTAPPVALPATGGGFAERARTPWLAVAALALVGLAAGLSTLELRRR